MSYPAGAPPTDPPVVPTVLFPDVERLVVTHLRSALPAAVGVGITRRADRSGSVPVRFVAIRRDGGPTVDRVLTAALLAVRVWAEDDQSATELALFVQHSITRMAGVWPVTDVQDLSGPSSVPDDESGLPMRYLTQQLYVLGD